MQDDDFDHTFAMPAEGTLERLFVDRLMACGEAGVTYLDFEGTGITIDNIDEVAENLRNGMYVSEIDAKIRFDA